MRSCTVGIIAAALLSAATVSQAAVTRIDVSERSDVVDGHAFGTAGPYERIVARVHFAVDPNNPANKIITDIALAPRNSQGLVEFSADLYMLKPRDPAKGNGSVLYEASNRGDKRLPELFNFAAARSLDPRTAKDLGDAFLLEQGYTVMWLGWQFDVSDRPGTMRVYVPVVKGVTGLVRAEFVPNEKVASFWLGDRGHQPYPVLDPADPSIQLTVRERGTDPRRVIPRSEWKFNGSNVEMPAGFEPGKFYDVVYTSQDAPVVGLGPAAIRDFLSFLKYGGVADPTLGDAHRHIKRAIGFGFSQTARLLRTFLYFGFNQDERNRQVLDGVWAHAGGAGRGSFNHRFAQPSRDGYLMLNTFYPTDLFPYTDLPQDDPETGLTEGLLDRPRASKVVPKIFYTNGSFEYWGRNSALIHTAIDGKRDMDLPDTTRVYFMAGTQHFFGGFPPERERTQHLANPNDYRYVMRGLLVALNEWVVTGTQPPPSSYPLIAKGQLVSPDAVRFPKIPGVSVPTFWLRAWRLDFGPEFRTKGLDTIEPPKVGKPFLTMVSQVDQDGIEAAGVRLPEIQVPLGTYTGWNMRDPGIGAPDAMINLVGSFFPFARTRAEREANKDPRLSIEERYASRDDYLGKISRSAGELVRSRYIMKSDVDRIVQRATEQWKYLAATQFP